MDHDLKSKISKMITDACDEENAGKRADLLDRYNAEPYGDEVTGRSKFVSSDSADAVEAMLPDVMDVFTGNESLLEFSPTTPEDEEAAKQETEAVSHIFWRKNPGFETLYTWIKEGFIQQNSYVWRGWVEKERTTFEEYEDLTPESLVALLSEQEGEYDLQEQTGFTVEDDPETGGQIIVHEVGEDGVPMASSVKIRCTKVSKEYVIEPFPQEDFFGTPRWGRLGLDGIPCCGRRHRNKRKEDLLALGFSSDSIDELTSGNDDEQKHARHHTRDSDESEATDETVEVLEAYLNIDRDNSGVLELVRVWCSEDGAKILKWDSGEDAVDPVVGIPINALTPYLMPHRHIGRSVVEQVDDIQQVKSVLMRHLLDNTYLTNYARPVFDENRAGPDTFDDLSSPGPGAPVRTGGAEIHWHMPPSVAGNVLPMLEKFDAMQENRVGATRYNQGLDANSLNKTASGISQIMNAGQKKTKLIARTIAETALRELFLGMHRDLRAGPVKSMMLKLKGAWTEVDPSGWRDRTDMVVNVGIGRGDRDSVRAAMMALGQVQEKLTGTRMVDEQKIYNTAARALETFGIDNIDQFLNNPQTLGPPPPPPPPAPDPMMIAAQTQAAKQQSDAQIAMAKLQADEARDARAHERAMLELQIKMQAEDRASAKTASDIQTDEETLDLRRKEIVAKDDLARDQMNVGGAPAVSYEQIQQN